MKKNLCIFPVLLIVLATVVSCGREEAKPKPDKITVQLKWVHQAQFAGFYTAKEKGFYAEENLDVDFLEGGVRVDVVAPVLSGKAQFGVMSPEDILIKRSQGEPLTAIAAIYRRSAVVYAALADSGIVRPLDFIGKSVAMAGSAGSVRDFELQFHALTKKLHLSESDMTLSPYDPDYKEFLKGNIDITAAYLTGGVIRLKREGHKLNLIWPGDYGVRFYSDTLATTQTMVDQHPKLVARFLRATLKGWKEAIGDPEAAATEIMKYAVIKDVKLQTAMMAAQAPLVHTGEDHIGWMKPGDWQEMHNVLLQQGIIPKAMDVDRVFTMQFLQQIYGEEAK